MTVADIKEFIDKVIKHSEETYIIPDKALILQDGMMKLKSMLDELKENNK